MYLEGDNGASWSLSLHGMYRHLYSPIDVTKKQRGTGVYRNDADWPREREREKERERERERERIHVHNAGNR